ncbi:DNA-binding transcriptional regulator, LysR family [Aureimonas altamirensis DSM 21988]|uniref:DNA-binding transcriptional regulator, LysR family n=1 Tax=Aureimonas altamirensis DSM 21988 TaxID=1121026 RepID=A0ABY1IBV1_9HYPH|nr:LysR family transcriptional regulator [Aureimonas altamirensis]SHI96630.1 DNA-binding transcriptional regulator, LysR family [Aureimonas altamirensis DSM 21988]
MDRRNLECFVAIADERHFHRAAARCNISQPGISQQLRKLEEHLGVVLMTRSSRQVSLTPAGEAFLPEARRIIQVMDDASRTAQRVERGEKGTLVIGATASSLFILVPEVIEAFRQIRPDIEVVVRHMTTQEQEAALERSEIQAGICHPPVSNEQLSCELLVTLPFSLVMPADHRLASRRTTRLSDLRDETAILFPRQVGPLLYDSIIALFQQEGFVPRQIIEASPVQSIIAMAACGSGIGFVASRVQQMQRRGVVYREISGHRPYITLGIAFPSAGPSSIARAFGECAKDVSADVLNNEK